MCAHAQVSGSVHVRTNAYSYINALGGISHMHECLAHSHLHTVLPRSLTVSHNSFQISSFLLHLRSVPRLPGSHRTVSSREKTFVPPLKLPLLVLPCVCATKRKRSYAEMSVDGREEEGYRQRETEKGEKKTDRPVSEV